MMKLTIQTAFDSVDTISVSIDGIYIMVQAANDDGIKSLILSPFEAQTLAEALLKMAANLEPRQELIGKDIGELGVIEYPTSAVNEMTLREPIESITITAANAARIKTKSGKVIFATKEVWAKGGKALQAECDKGKDSYMNINRDDSDSIW